MSQKSPPRSALPPHQPRHRRTICCAGAAIAGSLSLPPSPSPSLSRSDPSPSQPLGFGTPIAIAPMPIAISVHTDHPRSTSSPSPSSSPLHRPFQPSHPLVLHQNPTDCDEKTAGFADAYDRGWHTEFAEFLHLSKRRFTDFGLKKRREVPTFFYESKNIETKRIYKKYKHVAPEDASFI